MAGDVDRSRGPEALKDLAQHRGGAALPRRIEHHDVRARKRPESGLNTPRDEPAPAARRRVERQRRFTVRNRKPVFFDGDHVMAGDRERDRKQPAAGI